MTPSNSDIVRRYKKRKWSSETNLPEGAEEAASDMWQLVLERLQHHLRKVEGRANRREARRRRQHLVELIRDFRAENPRTKRKVVENLDDLAEALQSTLDVMPVSYRGMDPEAHELASRASRLLPRVRAERRRLKKAKTTGCRAVDAVMNMGGKKGRPSIAQAIARTADSYGLDALDVARLESVMIVGVPDIPEELRLPIPADHAAGPVGLYLSNKPPVFGDEIRSQRFASKWLEAYKRAGLHRHKKSP